MARKKYPLMNLREIKGMPVGDLADENSVCWLWVTNSTVDDGYDVLRAWGFVPKAILTWFKFRPHLGLGIYLRNDTEHVLLGVKGTMPIAVKNQPSWFIFTDGHTKEVSWQNPSRRESWTEEMKQAARERQQKIIERRHPNERAED